MFKIMRLANEKVVYIDGKMFSRDEAQEIIIRLTKTWGNDFQKRALREMVVRSEGE